MRKGEMYFSFGMFIALGVFAFAPHVLASTTGGNLPYETWLQSLRTSITGPVAFTLGTAGLVIGGGVLIFGGELNAFIRTMIFIVLTMAFIVDANNIMTSFFGSSAAVQTANGQGGAWMFLLYSAVFAGVVLAWSMVKRRKAPVHVTDIGEGA
jgi:type IV secretion system protein VirB2